jgi:hypothetical protein
MIDVFSVDPERDMPRKRRVEHGTADNAFIVQQKDNDPHGFWWVSREKGQAPDELKGAYTSPLLAEAAIQTYINKSTRK